jgi:GT2 family glycosyltransferase
VVSRCLSSVLASRDSSLGRVIVVDDASPDVDLIAYLHERRMQGEIEIVRHDVNLGVVAANNSGLAVSRRDVVFLNSDTEVHGDWVRRLLRCAYSAEAIGTVTPFSNEGSVCSYPYPTWWKGLPGGLGLADLDGLFAHANDGQAPADIPSGVSFCMLVKRACLDGVGPFDVQAFGRGYGDETDFCQRVALSGWRNVVCPDTFVYHQAGGSFGGDRVARAEAAERVLSERYPGYQGRVRDFMIHDPLSVLRGRVDAARARRSTDEAIAVLEERAAEKAWVLGWLASVVRAGEPRVS